MADVGYDLSTHRSMGLANLPHVECEAAVTMGCGDECPVPRAWRREYCRPRDLPPKQLRGVRDLIAEKVRALLAGLLKIRARRSVCVARLPNAAGRCAFQPGPAEPNAFSGHLVSGDATPRLGTPS